MIFPQKKDWRDFLNRKSQTAMVKRNRKEAKITLASCIPQLKIFTLSLLPSRCTTEKLAGNQTKTIYLNPGILLKHVISLDCQTSLRTPWKILKRSFWKNNNDLVQKKRKRSNRNSPNRLNTKTITQVIRASFAARTPAKNQAEKLSNLLPSRISPRLTPLTRNSASNQIQLPRVRCLETRIMSHKCLACLLLSKEMPRLRDLKTSILTKSNSQMSCPWAISRKCHTQKTMTSISMKMIIE